MEVAYFKDKHPHYIDKKGSNDEYCEKMALKASKQSSALRNEFEKDTKVSCLQAGRQKVTFFAGQHKL